MTRILLAVWLVLLAVLQPARADLNGEIQSMYDGLVNVSPPGAFDTQRRGVLSGGSVYARSRIYNANLVSFAPPRFEAGCGGIDFFAGSFSFINGEQFQALLRAVAANAAGYAFELALGSMCPQCLSTIETLQQKIQQLNQHFGNSCQLAQGLVNDTLGAMVGHTVGDASLVATAEGAVDDIFSSWTGAGGQNPVQQAQATGSSEVNQRVFGNLVWRALKNQGVSGWFIHGDNDLLQVLMNLSGTVIVSPPESGSESPVVTNTVAPSVGLVSAIVEGTDVAIQGCADGFDADSCLKVATVTISLQGKGFRQRIEQAFLGSGTSPGIIAKVRNNTLGAPTAEERAISGMMTGAVGSMVVRLSRYSEEAAREFAREASYYLAIQMTEMLVKSAHESVGVAMGGEANGFIPALQELLTSSRQAISDEILRLTETHGSFSDMINLYQEYMSVMPPAPLMPTAVSTEN